MLKSGIVNTKCNMVREILTDQAGFQTLGPWPTEILLGSTSCLDRDLAWLYISTDAFKPRQISAKIGALAIEV